MGIREVCEAPALASGKNANTIRLSTKSKIPVVLIKFPSTQFLERQRKSVKELKATIQAKLFVAQLLEG